MRIQISALLLLVASCGSTPADRPGPLDATGAPAPGELQLVGPWTRAFLQPSWLVADEIRIEGPPALRDRLAVRQDSDATTYSAETTEQGLLQVTTARAGLGLVEIHAQLDAWQLVAFRRLVWLERPGDVAVTLRATGDVKWGTETGATREGPVLEFRGDRAR